MSDSGVEVMASVFDLRSSRRRLWSSRRCLVFFSVAIALFTVIVWVAGVGIRLEPSRPAHLVADSRGVRVELESGMTLPGAPIAFRLREGQDGWGARWAVEVDGGEWRLPAVSVEVLDASPRKRPRGVVLSTSVTLWEFAWGAIE